MLNRTKPFEESSSVTALKLAKPQPTRNTLSKSTTSLVKLSLALLCGSLLAAPYAALGAERNSGSRSVKIIEPKERSHSTKSAIIDTEKFQLGAYAGVLAVEDFNASALVGISFSYQLSESYLLLAQYGTADVGKATIEKRDDLVFLTESQRTFSYFSLLGGYKLYSARSFLGPKHKYDSDIYLLGGLGNMDYAGVNNLGVTVGASYRVVFTDWLVASADIKNHIYKANNVFSDKDTKTTQNIEFSLGLNALF